MTPEPSAPRRSLPGQRGAIRSARQQASMREMAEWAEYSARATDPNRRPGSVPAPRVREDVSSHDPAYDFDLPARYRALMKTLAEHPAMRPLLRERDLSYRTSQPDGLLMFGCTRCPESPCQCDGPVSDRANDLMAVAFCDRELRPLFDAQRLVVLQ